MGDPRKLRNKFSGPSHPWQRARMEEEKVLLKEYGLKNKTEIWKVNSKFKSVTKQAKKLIAATGTQADLERLQLINRLNRLGLVKPNAKLDDVLGLNLKDFLERRLQTLVFRKKLAKSAKQARQFISHEHILIGKKKVTAPSYFVKINEEPMISFASTSKLSNSEHPERKIEEKAPKKIIEKAKNETKTRTRPKSKAK